MELYSSLTAVSLNKDGICTTHLRKLDNYDDAPVLPLPLEYWPLSPTHAFSNLEVPLLFCQLVSVARKHCIRVVPRWRTKKIKCYSGALSFRIRLYNVEDESLPLPPTLIEVNQRQRDGFRFFDTFVKIMFDMEDDVIFNSKHAAAYERRIKPGATRWQRSSL